MIVSFVARDDPGPDGYVHHQGRAPGSGPPRLMAQVRAAARLRHYSRRTEKAYAGWIRRYIAHHGKRHPAMMGEREVTEFLRARRPSRLPTVLTRTEVSRILAHLARGTWGRSPEIPERSIEWLVISLIY